MGIINNAQHAIPSADEMEVMPWQDLYDLRLKFHGNQDAQQLIAPFEHQAYAREQVAENPLAAPAWAVMPAAYQAAKALGLAGGDDDMSTPASLDQAVAGVKGVWQGVKQAMR